MTWAFPVLALAMLAVGSLFLAWPLWRRADAVLESAGAVSSAPRKPAAIGLALLLILASVAAYTAIGRPQAWLDPEVLKPVVQADATQADPAPSAEAGDGPVPEGGGVGPAQIEAMVARLAQRLQTQPDDADGWRMLARSYETLRRFDEAVQAYQRLIALRQPDADVLVDYAVAMGMSQGQTLKGEPQALLAQALRLQPAHPQALALSGSAAFEQQDYTRAISHWQALLSHVPADAEMRTAIEANIDKARALSRKP